MKILVCSDLHLGGTRYRKFDKEGVNQYMLSNFNNFNYIIDYCKNNNIEKMIIPGDVFDKSNVSTVALYMARDMFEKLKDNGTEVFAIKGNHDKSDILDLKGYTAISFVLDEDHRFENKPGIKNIDGVNFVFIPWGEDIDTSLIDKNAKYNVLVAHGYPKNYFDYLGRKQTRTNKAYDTEEGILSEEKTKQFDMVLTGHYHTTDEFTIGNTKYINPGSISPSTTHVKDKQHIPCFYVLETDDLSYEKVEIESSIKIVKDYTEEIDDYLDNIEDNFVYRIKTNKIPNRKSLIKAQRKAMDIQVTVDKEERREVVKVDDFWCFVHNEHPDYEKGFRDIISL